MGSSAIRALLLRTRVWVSMGEARVREEEEVRTDAVDGADELVVDVHVDEEVATCARQRQLVCLCSRENSADIHLRRTGHEDH